MPPMKRLAGKTMEHDIARARVYLKGGAAGNYPLFIPAISNESAVTFYPMAGIQMANGALTTVGGGMFQIPAGWSGTLTVSAIVEVGNSTAGNVYSCIRYHRAAVGSLIISTTPAYAAQAIEADSNDKYLSINSQVINGAAAGDLVNLGFERFGSHGSDTYEADIYCYGFLIDWG